MVAKPSPASWLGRVSEMLKLPYDSVVFAAGRGTRLGEITDKVAKPMLHVLGRPLLYWQVTYLRHGGLEPTVTAWWKSNQILGLGSAMEFDVTVEDYLQPPGQVLHALAEGGCLQDIVVCLNGDTIVPKHPALLAERLRSLPATFSACLLVRPWTEYDRDKGVLVPHNGNWKPVEKPDRRYPGSKVWTGAAAIRSSAILEHPSGDSLLQALSSEGKLATIETRQPELDIGTWAAYRHADEYLTRYYMSEFVT